MGYWYISNIGKKRAKKDNSVVYSVIYSRIVNGKQGNRTTTYHQRSSIARKLLISTYKLNPIWWMSDISYDQMYDIIDSCFSSRDDLCELVTQCAFRMYLESLLEMSNFSVIGTGSRYVCNPPVYDTDEDYVLYVPVNEYLHVVKALCSHGWALKGGYISSNTFEMFENKSVDIILTTNRNVFLGMQDFNKVAREGNPADVFSKNMRRKLAELCVEKRLRADG